MAGVEQQVGNRVFDFDFEGFRRRQTGLAEIVNERRQPAVQVDAFPHRRVAARYLQDVLDDVVDPQRVLVDDFDHTLFVVADIFVFVQQLGGVGDRAQGVADFVCDVGG